MSGVDRFERKTTAPRRVRNGLRLRAGAGEGEALARSWLAQRVLALLEGALPRPALRAGLDYARRGQVVSMTVAPGGVAARVQGRAPQPYETRVRFPVLDPSQCRSILDAMAAEALYEAKLLADELPPALARLFEAGGVPLLPAAASMAIECDCPGAAQFPGGCKHAAAVGYLLVERLDERPLSIFTLLGLPDVLERLAQARAARSHGAAPAGARTPAAGTGAAAAPAAPPESALLAFWRPGPELASLQAMEPPHHAPHALLRRLGPSPLPGRFPLVGLLASVYDTVGAWAIRLRDRAEGLE